MNLHSVVVATALALAASSAAAASPECTALADEKRLVGVAKTNFIRKCVADLAGDPLAMCERAADQQQLRGAVRNGHIKKCLAEKPKKG